MTSQFYSWMRSRSQVARLPDTLVDILSRMTKRELIEQVLLKNSLIQVLGDENSRLKHKGHK
jgi:hypothetical protein